MWLEALVVTGWFISCGFEDLVKLTGKWDGVALAGAVFALIVVFFCSGIGGSGNHRRFFPSSIEVGMTTSVMFIVFSIPMFIALTSVNNRSSRPIAVA